MAKRPVKNSDSTPDLEPFFGHEIGQFRSALKLAHLRLLVMIEEVGQVSLAAEALNMTQPAASRILTEMEALMKCQLCRRASRGVVLTQYGKALSKRGRKILLELREADREITQLKIGNGGTVHIGAVSAPSMSLVVPAVNAAMRKFPSIEINIDVDNSNVLIRDLLSAKYDFVIGRIPDDANTNLFTFHEIGVEKASFAVRNEHPLMLRHSVSIADMAKFEWVFQPPGTLLRRAVEELFLKHNLRLPSNLVNTPSIVLGLALLKSSDCIMPVSQDMAAFITDQSGDIGKIAQLPTNFELIVRPYGLITMKDRMLTPTAQSLYDLIREQANSIMDSQKQS